MKDNFTKDLEAAEAKSFAEYLRDKREQQMEMHHKMRVTLAKAGFIALCGVMCIGMFSVPLAFGVALLIAAEMYLRFSL